MSIKRSVKSNGVLQRFKLTEFESLWVVSQVKNGKITYLLGEGETPVLFDDKLKADTWVSSMALLEQIEPGQIMVAPLNIVRQGSMWTDYKAAP